MSWKKKNRGWLIFGFIVFVGGIVAVTSVVTLQWSDQIEGLLEPKPDPKADRVEVYDLPDHSGRLVAEDEGDRVGLPRLKADYEVDIRGDLATVTVDQTFKNPTEGTLHPTYQFPLYAEAAVYAMTMQIGERTIEADVKKKEEAREEYERAKRQGKNAALLSQNRPNLFTQRVANVDPGQTVEITIRYTHAVPKDEGKYRLLVPMAIGERYTPSDMSENALVEGEGSAAGELPDGATLDPDQVSLTVRIDGGMPVTKVRSSTHAIRLESLSETDKRVEMAGKEIRADRHFRMRYRLAGDETAAGMNAYWDEMRDEGYFNLRVEPPISPAADQTINREMVFAIDKSGSMRGAPLRDTKRFVSKAIQNLRPDDHFRIVLFSSRASDFSTEPLPATEGNIERARAFLGRLRAGGGTQMARGIRRVFEPAVPEDTIRLVTFLTDGQVSNDFHIIKLLRRELGEARMFAVGVGGDANTFLLEEMGRAGRGFTKVLDPGESNYELIDDAVRRLQTPVMTDVTVDWGDLEVSDVTPETAPDVFGRGTVRIHGRYENPGKHRVFVRGKGAGGQTVELPLQITLPDSPSDGEAVKLAWARRKIADAMHELETPDELRRTGMSGEELKQQVIDLGLRHDLSTQWTSFVAVDEASGDGRPPVEETAVEEPGVNRMLDSTNLGSGPLKNIFGNKDGFDSKMNVAMDRDESKAKVGKGSGGMGLKGAGRGGGAAKTKSAKPAPSPKPTPKKRRAKSGSKNDAVISAFGEGGGGFGSLKANGATRGGGGDDEAKILGIGEVGTVGEGGSGSGQGAEDLGDRCCKRPKVVPQKPTVNGSLDKEIIRRVVRMHRREIKYCYEKELQKNPELEGRVVLDFVIAADGKVTSTTVSKSTLDNTAAESCMSAKVKRWVFPEPKDDGVVKVSYPFDFSVDG